MTCISQKSIRNVRIGWVAFIWISFIHRISWWKMNTLCLCLVCWLFIICIYEVLKLYHGSCCMRYGLCDVACSEDSATRLYDCYILPLAVLGSKPWKTHHGPLHSKDINRRLHLLQLPNIIYAVDFWQLFHSQKYGHHNPHTDNSTWIIEVC